MKSRFLILFFIAALLLTMFVCICPTTVHAASESTDSTESSSDTLGDTLEDEVIFGFGGSEYFDGPLGKILGGLIFVFAAIINAIGAVFTTVITLVVGMGTFLWGIVEFFIGLFK